MLLQCSITKRRTALYHPRSDGAVDRCKKISLGVALSKVWNTSRDNQDVHLPIILLGYRTSRHCTTKLSPARVLIGREATLPGFVRVDTADLLQEAGAQRSAGGACADDNIGAYQLATVLCKRIEQAKNIERLALTNIELAQDNMVQAWEKKNEKHKTGATPQVDDLVLLRINTLASTGRRNMTPIRTTDAYIRIGVTSNRVYLMNAVGNDWWENLEHCK